jgi:hypothetical protein
MPIDSPYYVPVPIDSPYCKKDTVIIEKPCPPVIECPECKPATWKSILLVVSGALAVVFLILFFNEKNK